MKNRLVVWGLAITLVVGGSLAFSLTSRGASSGGDRRFEDLRVVLEVISLVRTHYVDPVDVTGLVAAYIQKGTINGMLQAALHDRYTRFLPRRAYGQMQIETRGVFTGLGINVGIKDDRITVIAPIPGTPAARAGLLPGDRIVHIDGRPTDYMSLDEAVSLMRGERGSPVVLGIERANGQRSDVRIVRSVIEVPSVSQIEVLRPGTYPGLSAPVGYVRLLSFTERTEGELSEALERLEREGVRGLILDLRYNPGGLFGAAIGVANLFLEGGPIVHIVGRDRDRRTVFASGDGRRVNVPLVVLVNEYSASASEIVSGALQDRGVATLVGTRTFGKGLVQTVIPLRDGSALSLTTARYETAGGRQIDGSGIVPDVVVPDPAGERAGEPPDPAALLGEVDLQDVQLRRAVELLEEKLAGGAPAPRQAATAAARARPLAAGSAARHPSGSV
ncbi:MAG TPA: S41 family peptidase [Limnochordia bacterium]